MYFSLSLWAKLTSASTPSKQILIRVLVKPKTDFVRERTQAPLNPDSQKIQSLYITQNEDDKYNLCFTISRTYFNQTGECLNPPGHYSVQFAKISLWVRRAENQGKTKHSHTQACFPTISSESSRPACTFFVQHTSCSLVSCKSPNLLLFRLHCRRGLALR